MAGRSWAATWREWREKRKSRVKAGEFFGSCCCYAVASVFSFIESIPGTGNRNAILAHARHAPVSRRLGSGRAVFLFLDFCAWLCKRFLAVIVGCRAAYCHPRALLRLQIPYQRESRLDDSTPSAMPIHILAQGYYITDFDAIALLRNPIQTQFPCLYPLKPVRPLHITRVNSTAPRSL